MLNRPRDDPPRHRVDIPSNDVAPEPVRLDERAPAAHKGVGNPDPFQVGGPEEGVRKRAIDKLRQQQGAKERARPTSEPFMNVNPGSVVLLNLLFPQGELRDKRDVKAPLYGHFQLSFGYPPTTYPILSDPAIPLSQAGRHDRVWPSFLPSSCAARRSM